MEQSRLMFTTISHEVEDGTVTVTVDRAEHLNSFTVEMADELTRARRVPPRPVATFGSPRLGH